MNLVLREMDMADIETVLRIEQQVNAHPWTRGNFIDALASNNICKVYADRDTIMGYAVFIAAVDDAELLDIVIAGEYQHRGLGSKLLQECMDCSRRLHLHRMLLEVRPSNSPARRLYQAAGFREIALRRGYYAAVNGREDAIVMECIL